MDDYKQMCNYYTGESPWHIFFLKFMSPMASVFTFHLGDIVTLKPLYFDPRSTLLKLESVSAHLGMYYFSL